MLYNGGKLVLTCFRSGIYQAYIFHPKQSSESGAIDGFANEQVVAVKRDITQNTKGSIEEFPLLKGKMRRRVMSFGITGITKKRNFTTLSKKYERILK